MATDPEFNQADLGQEAHFLPGEGGWGVYGPGQVFAWPCHNLCGRGMGGGSVAQTTTYVGVPLGGVAMRRDEPAQPCARRA